jgi:hypothetical protein
MLVNISMRIETGDVKTAHENITCLGVCPFVLVLEINNFT